MTLPPNIHRYKNGLRVKISVTRPDGTRHRPSIYLPGPVDKAHIMRAEIARAELIQQWVINDTPPTTIEPGTVTELLENWYTARHPHIQQTTADNYRHGINRILPYIGHLQADKITPEILEHSYLSMLATGSNTGGPVSGTTVRQSHGCVTAAYRHAIKRGHATRNPAEHAQPPPKNPSRTEPPTAAAVNAALTAVTGPPWRRALLELAVTTGARRSELLGLRWSDIDLDGLSVRRVRRVAITSRGADVRESSKTGRRLVRLSIDEPTAAAIRRQQNGQRATALASGAALVDDPWLFNLAASPSCAEVMSPSTVSTWWMRYRKRHAGLAGVRWHDLRHFVITQSLAAGEPVDIVAERAGHSDGTMVLRNYRHHIPEADRSAAATMRRVIDGGG